jgi:hypothetical protein
VACNAAVQFSIAALVAALEASVHRVVLLDSFRVGAVRCILRATNLEILQELLVPVLGNSGLVSVARVPALAAHAPGWEHPDLFRPQVKRRVRSGRVDLSAVDVSNTRRPKKAR